jgi:uncharacterized phage protein (TIGR01671 family)
MREIKFRGKKASGDWVFGELVMSPTIDPAIYFEVGNGSVKQMDWVYVNENTIGQYIGLKDKNGKEIYEGDIVTMEDFGFTRERPFIVVYDNFDAGFKFRGVYCLVTPNSKCEVIGNIEDNPNLIPID